MLYYKYRGRFNFINNIYREKSNKFKVEKSLITLSINRKYK